MRFAKSSGNQEYPPCSPLRKQVEKAVHESESARNLAAWQDGLLAGRGLSHFTLIFCFAALSGTEAGTGQGGRLTAVTSAHDSLQMPVKYEDGVFQTHRQIHAVVYTSQSGLNLRS
jgi:hypothetical protein